MLEDERLRSLAHDLTAVPGVLGVTLGGSRARGTHLPTSDVDLGVYYTDGLDVPALAALARRWTGDDVPIAAPGEWGPWVDGGAWLTVDGVAVDWILRDVRRVGEQCRRAREGRFAFHVQPGHPFGFLDVAYVGELVTALVLADPMGELVRMRREIPEYPDALRRSLTRAGAWQAAFLVEIAAKGVARGDVGYVALCLTSALMWCAHTWHAEAGVWVTNEKDLIPNVARLPLETHDFSARAAQALAHLGNDPGQLRAAADAVGAILAEAPIGSASR